MTAHLGASRSICGAPCTGRESRGSPSGPVSTQRRSGEAVATPCLTPSTRTTSPHPSGAPATARRTPPAGWCSTPRCPARRVRPLPPVRRRRWRAGSRGARRHVRPRCRRPARAVPQEGRDGFGFGRHPPWRQVPLQQRRCLLVISVVHVMLPGSSGSTWSVSRTSRSARRHDPRTAGAGPVTAAARASVRLPEPSPRRPGSVDPLVVPEYRPRPLSTRRIPGIPQFVLPHCAARPVYPLICGPSNSSEHAPTPVRAVRKKAEQRGTHSGPGSGT